MRPVFALLALLSALPALADERGPAVPDYEAEAVSGRTYVIHGPTGYPSPQNQGFMNNPAFVITRDGVVVVDPGSSVQTGEMVLRQIRKRTDLPILAVLNTHAHGDHFLGNQAVREAYPQVPVFGHPNMIQAMNEGAGESWVERMERATEGATRGTVAVAPNTGVQQGDVVRIGGITFRFHHAGTAHTNNDLMIEVPEEGVLFLADNVNNRRIVRMDDGSFRGNVAAIDAALKLRAKVLIPGHGRTGDWSIVHAYREYLDGLHQAVKKYYDEGLADFEMRDKVAADLARFKDWPGFDDELGRHISLVYLEIESAQF